MQPNDLPSDIKFAFFLATVDPVEVVKERATATSAAERKYLQYLLRQARHLRNAP